VARGIAFILYLRKKLLLLTLIVAKMLLALFLFKFIAIYELTLNFYEIQQSSNFNETFKLGDKHRKRKKKFRRTLDLSLYVPTFGFRKESSQPIIKRSEFLNIKRNIVIDIFGKQHFVKTNQLT
jgi:hypothetical protein